MTGEPKTVLLTGANGWLGRFLTLELLERASQTDGTVITVVRGHDEAAARGRLEAAFDSGDPDLLKRFRKLAADHLEVVAGNIGEPNLGVDKSTWDRLAHNVDQIIHPAALVNHVLPYTEEFGPNVVGTAEIIRLAITARIEPVTYLSTVAVGCRSPRRTSSRMAISAMSFRCARSAARTPTATRTASGPARCSCGRRTTSAAYRSRCSGPT